jgi:hypothetical protein
VGSGSTAAAVRAERVTGQPVGGKWHTQKAEEGMTRLLSWMRRHREISDDSAAAEAVYRDLKESLSIPKSASGKP